MTKITRDEVLRFQRERQQRIAELNRRSRDKQFCRCEFPIEIWTPDEGIFCTECGLAIPILQLGKGWHPGSEGT